jgi:KaiC/GvpD/RAD55 family RecA-like ATPase
MDNERCHTGIAGFDELCEGGFVRNSINCIIGGPGSGKTIFLLQFLYQGTTLYKESGVYLSFEQDVVELYKDGIKMGWDLEELDKKNDVKFIKISPYTTVSELKKELTFLTARYDVKRICFDPINLFGKSEEKEHKIRMMLVDMTSLLKRFNVTTLLSAETTTGDVEEIGIVSAGEDGVNHVKFLSDSLIHLHTSGLGGISDRALRIVKMRRTNHTRGPVPIQITNKGIAILKKNGRR